jgi:hypothetical protein
LVVRLNLSQLFVNLGPISAASMPLGVYLHHGNLVWLLLPSVF